MIFISQLHTLHAIRSACLIRISTCNHVTDHFAMWSYKMAGRKRPSSSTSVSESSSSDGSPASKRRMLLANSVNKWIAEHDKELNTSTWLTYTVFDRLHMDVSTCSVCTRLKNKLESMRNYNPAYMCMCTCTVYIIYMYVYCDINLMCLAKNKNVRAKFTLI